METTSIDTLAASIRELLTRQIETKQKEALDAINALELGRAESALNELKAIYRLQVQIDVILPPVLPRPVQVESPPPQKPVEKPKPTPVVVSPAVPTPKPKPDPVPEPKPVPAKAKPVPKIGREIGRRRDEFMAAVRAIEANPNDFREALGKALICAGRGCAEEADERDRQTVKSEVQRAIAMWNRQTREKEFFGCNPTRGHKADIWFELAEDYRKLDVVQETRDFLESEPLVDESERRVLIDRAAAAETLFFRVNQEKGLGVADSQHRDLHNWLSDQHVPVPWWREETNGGPSTREIREAANELPDLLKRERGRAAQSAAKARLFAFTGADPGPDFIRDLAELLQSCLAAGVRPSEKALTTIAMPFVRALRELNRSDLETMLRHTEKQLGAIAGKVDFEKLDEVVEGERALRPLVEGKTVAFIGGNKGQEKRRQELIDRLGLKDLIWPDSEDHTNPRVLKGAADKADIVALLIRFSRHSYKGVLDHAKATGKQTVVITSGLGVNRIVHDMLRQLG